MKRKFSVTILIVAGGVLISGLLSPHSYNGDSNINDRLNLSQTFVAAEPVSVVWNGAERTENGRTWKQISSPATSTPLPTNEMDPNMPGMTHTESAPATRPLTIVLGTFGFAVTTVFIWAGLAKRRDRRRDAAKVQRRVATELSK